MRAALAQAAERLPGFAPRSLLDAGAGPGTAAWAAVEQWPGLRRTTLLEREPEMIALGRRLMRRSGHAALRGAAWVRADLVGSWAAEAHDLVTASYVLGELAPERRRALVARLWSCAAGLLVLVEPGTPAGTARILEAREQLLAEGACPAAPCPHDGPCPQSEDGWCHFSQRVARSRLHRLTKGAELAYEDEKFAFLALSRAAAAPCAGRVLRHPLVRKGHVQLAVCTPAGIREVTVARSRGEHYRRAKDLRWGSALPPGLLDE